MSQLTVKKLTKKQREQIVALLRCAADVERTSGDDGILTAADAFGCKVWPISLIERAAWQARNDAMDAISDAQDWHADVLLEAAMRVEEGSWP